MNNRIGISQMVIPLVIAVGTIIILFVLLLLLGQFSQSRKAVVEQGKLDLTEWDFEDGGNVALDGNWEFYWDRSIMPEEFKTGSPQITGNYPVPVYWTKYEGLNLPSKGKATYRLVIDTNIREEMMAISIPELYTEYALYINGSLLVGNGALGGTSFRYLDPDSFMFELPGSRIEIILQLENRTHVYGGVGQSFVLGTVDDIYRIETAETAIDLILVGICLFSGLYHLVLFMGRKKDYKLLCFAVFCIAVALRGLITNVTYIMEIFPQLSFEIGSGIVTMTIPVLTVSMLLYVYFIFHEYISKRYVQGLCAVSFIYMLLIVLTDPYVYSCMFFVYLIVPVKVSAIGFYVALLAIRDKTREAMLYLAGTLVIVAVVVNDILVYLQLLDTGYRLGAGLVAFAVTQSFIMAIQYIRFIEEKEELYDKLHETDLAFLQAQIKPHFIYNALSAISHMTGTQPQKAKELLLDFSDYLRGCFDFSNTSGLTTLSKEMDFVKAYLSIEKARYQDRLNVEYAIDENLQVMVPVLCIQPIVENAVRHGLMPRSEGGNVKISVWNEKGDTVIRVEDDGIGMTEDKIKEIYSGGTSSSGLTNINGRLRLKFGTELKIASKPGEGTVVEIIVPTQK